MLYGTQFGSVPLAKLRHTGLPLASAMTSSARALRATEKSL